MRWNESPLSSNNAPVISQAEQVALCAQVDDAPLGTCGSEHVPSAEPRTTAGPWWPCLLWNTSFVWGKTQALINYSDTGWLCEVWKGCLPCAHLASPPQPAEHWLLVKAHLWGLADLLEISQAHQCTPNNSAYDCTKKIYLNYWSFFWARIVMNSIYVSFPSNNLLKLPWLSF